MMPIDSVPRFLDEMGCGGVDFQALLQSVSGPGVHELSFDQCVALAAMLQNALGPSTSAVSLGSDGTTLSRAPLKKVLTKNRSYLETGNLTYDEAVLSYLMKLDDHRKKCEVEGRYDEARAAANRLADLKTAQVERLRSELVANQARELEEVHKVFDEETGKFVALWDRRVREYETNFGRAVEDLRAAHEEQRARYTEELLTRKPLRPKPSRDYLNQKRIEESLAKNRQYQRASEVRAAADELLAAEIEAAQAAYEAEQRLRVTKFSAKQQQEFEALLQRGARGRDELELRRVAETERRTYRFRNIVMELENLHRLEIVQLESFLDNQVQAGKAVPLKDVSAFRRKREVLYNSPI